MPVHGVHTDPADWLKRRLHYVETVLHIIYRDKFTSGYIDFMNFCMKQYCHRFLVRNKGFRLDLQDTGNISSFDTYRNLLLKKQYREMLSKADIIVVSGVFIDWDFFRILAFSPSLLKKTVFHFWGGDFYRYRDETMGKSSPVQRAKNRIKMLFRSYCFRNCNDIAFLVQGDYDAFRSILGLSRSYSIVKMPGSPVQKRISEYRNTDTHDGVRIVLGNSATASNCHEEILNLLYNQYRDEAMEIYCPLSYGEQEYRDWIIRLGNDLFGERFIPMTEYMEKEDYTKFLSGCDIGIFNNDRQQGMGNIGLLLGLGKKVYIRTDTSMWNRYREKGYIVFPVEDIQKQTFAEFISLSPQIRESNTSTADHNPSVENSINAWTPFLQNAILRNLGN